jgi:hypothetical protein
VVESGRGKRSGDEKSGDESRTSAFAVLELEDGFVLEPTGDKNTVALMRQSDGLGVATISCGCSGSGSCGIVIDVGSGLAECRGDCSGGCAWVITSLGLRNRLVMA